MTKEYRVTVGDGVEQIVIPHRQRAEAEAHAVRLAETAPHLNVEAQAREGGHDQWQRVSWAESPFGAVEVGYDQP